MLIQRSVDRKIGNALNKWVEEERYLLEMTPREAAEELGTSMEQMSFYFRMYVGTEFRCWRKQMRIEKAKIIMKLKPELPFSTIGEYVGISDKGNFRRQFYEVCHEWPAQWKERNVKR